MDKISPEEKIQWMKKILQKKESISSVASKIGVYYTTVDKWLRNYKAIGPEAFFRKGHTYRTPAQKEAAVFDYLSGKGSQVLSGISVPGTKFQMHRYSEDGL